MTNVSTSRSTMRDRLTSGESLFSVLQYVPDVTADERINIGVVTIGRETYHVSILDDWQRVRNFGSEVDLSEIRAFAHRLRRDAQDGVTGQVAMIPPSDRGVLTMDDLEQMLDWAGSLQFTEPMPILLPAEQALEVLAPRYLITRPAAPERGRHKRVVARQALRAIRLGLERRLGDLDRRDVSVRREEVVGRLFTTPIDIVIRNGGHYGMVEAVSFELESTGEMQRQIRAVLFALDDVVRGKRYADAHLVITAGYPPQPERRPEIDALIEQTERSSRDIGVALVDVDDLTGVISELATRIDPIAAGRAIG